MQCVLGPIGFHSPIAHPAVEVLNGVKSDRASTSPPDLAVTVSCVVVAMRHETPRALLLRHVQVSHRQHLHILISISSLVLPIIPQPSTRDPQVRITSYLLPDPMYFFEQTYRQIWVCSFHLNLSILTLVSPSPRYPTKDTSLLASHSIVEQ